MIGFVIVACLLTAGALAFALPPLLGHALARPSHVRAETNLAILRDQQRELEAALKRGEIEAPHFTRALSEIQLRALLEGRAGPESPVSIQPAWRWVWMIGLGIPALVVPLYMTLGTPGALAPKAPQFQATHAITADQIRERVASLAERLAQNPEDNEGWIMLARSYSALGQYREAAQAYQMLATRIPDDAQLLADYADTLAMAQGRRLSGEPERLIGRALALDGQNLKARALAGTLAFQQNRYPDAIAQWEQALQIAPPDSNAARSLQNSIADARSRLPAGATVNPQIPASAAQAVAGTVRIAPALMGALRPDDTVFIYARAPGGPKMPLAMIRRTVADLPTPFVLDDRLAMAPSVRISAFNPVEVVARISRSGTAQAQSGDLEATARTVPLGTQGLELTIDRAIP